MEAPLSVGKGKQNCIIGWKPQLGSVEGVHPRVELLTAVPRRERWIVGDVVAATHEGVYRAERLALDLGKDQKSVVEVLGALTRDPAADRVRHVQLRLGRHKLWRVLRHGGHISL